MKDGWKEWNGKADVARKAKLEGQDRNWTQQVLVKLARLKRETPREKQ